MLRTATAVISAAALAVLLAACGTPGTPDAGPAPRPTAADGAPVPSPAVTETATPTPTAAPAFRIPTCDALFTPAEASALLTPGSMFDPTITSPGTSVPELRDLASHATAVNCAWVLPGSEAGTVVSLVTMSDAIRLAVEDFHLGHDYEPVNPGSDIPIYYSEGREDFIFTEAQALTPELWITVFQGHGTHALDIVQSILDELATLNP